MEHAYDECTGNWRLCGSGPRRSIRCAHCSASYPATPENRTTAIDENHAGIYLRRLTAEGEKHLQEGDGDP